MYDSGELLSLKVECMLLGKCLKFLLIMMLASVGGCANNQQLWANDQSLQGFVIILNSYQELKDLQKYPVEIVRIRSIVEKNSSKNNPVTPRKVEAIASHTTIERLILAGFKVTSRDKVGPRPFKDKRSNESRLPKKTDTT
jgi:hypothetical protein